MSNPEADAVMAAFSGTVMCDCGIEHTHGDLVRDAKSWKNRVPCDGCKGEHSVEVNCACGTMLSWGPKKGWKVARRKHALWLKREKAFTARITELEAQRAN